MKNPRGKTAHDVGDRGLWSKPYLPDKRWAGAGPQRVDLTVEKGEFVSFIGPSGCGKTTFLRCVAALEAPTGGTLSVNGMTPDAARRARAYGYVFQHAGLYPWRTIGGNIRLPLEIMGYSKTDRDARVSKTLDLVDLTGFETNTRGNCQVGCNNVPASRAPSHLMPISC